MYPTDKAGSNTCLNDREVSRGHSSRFAMKDRTLIILINIGGLICHVPALFRKTSRRRCCPAALCVLFAICPAISFLLSAFQCNAGSSVSRSPSLSAFYMVSLTIPIPHACSCPAVCVPLQSSFYHAP